MIEKITNENFENTVLASAKPVLVDFFATWCGPCRSMHPVMEELAVEEDFVTAQVDIDEAADIASRYSIMSVPTFLVFKEGKMTDRFVGTQSKQDLLSALRS